MKVSILGLRCVGFVAAADLDQDSFDPGKSTPTTHHPHLPALGLSTRPNTSLDRLIADGHLSGDSIDGLDALIDLSEIIVIADAGDALVRYVAALGKRVLILDLRKTDEHNQCGPPADQPPGNVQSLGNVRIPGRSPRPE